MKAWKVGLFLPLIAGVAIALTAELTVQSGTDPEVVQSGTDPEADSETFGTVPTAPPTDQPEDPAVTAAKQAIEEDNAKPRFQGLLGDFEIVGREGMNNFPCSEGPSVPSEAEARASELFFEEPSLVGLHGPGGPAVSMCGGEIHSVSGDLVEGGGVLGAYVVRSYFVNEHPQLPLETPEERLALTEVAGLPALLELPAQDLVPGCRVFVIERPSTAESPGVILEVTGGLDCETAQALAADFIAGFARS